MSSIKDKYIQMAENRSDFDYIDNSNFITPDMNEMIQEDLMAEIYEQYVDGNTDGEYKDKAILDANFYTEQPFTTSPGHYPQEGAFVLKVDRSNITISETSFELNKFDGDTYSFSLKAIDDGGQPVILSKHGSESLSYKNFKEYFKKMGGGSSIQVRFLGIDAAEIPHYEVQPVLKKTDRIKSTTYKEMLEMRNHNTTILYEKHPYIDGKVVERKAEDKVELLLVSNEKGKKQYVEIITRMNGQELYANGGGSINSEYNYYVVIATQDESTSNKIQDGYKAQAAVKKLLKESSEIVLVLNANGITADRSINTTTGKTFNSIYYFDDIVKYLVDEWDAYYGDLALTNYSYIPYGMDNYKRSLGVIYVKHNGEWINLSKYVLCQTEHTIANPSFNDSPELQSIGSGISDSFNLWSYDRNNIEWLDSFDKIASKTYDARIELHKKLTGIDFLKVRDCAVLIGDTLMLIPPENIRNITQVSYERLPNIRSKGTMAKDKGNNEHMLEMTLYFYEESGINGLDYSYTTPNGTVFNYKMNGLRSLIAQFKVAPFLPIENGYINDVLGIEAVALMNMNLQNVEGFPRLIKVILTLKEFNYRVYMPDMPLEDKTDNESTEYLSKQTPMFAKSFNWEIFRYYYQRALMAGNDLAEIEKAGGFGTYDYNLKYYTHKNTIGPWLFCGPLSTKGEISFYIPDEDWLNSALQVKKERDNLLLTNTSGIELSDTARDHVKRLAQMIKNVQDVKAGKNEEFNAVVEDFIGNAVNKKHKIGISIPLTVGDGVTNNNIDISGISSVKVYEDDELGLNAGSFRDRFVLPMKQAFMNAVNDASYMNDININETLTKDLNDIYFVTWDFCIRLNLQNITDDDFRDIKEMLGKEVDLKPDQIFIDDTVRISYKMSFKDEGWWKGSLNISDAPGSKQYNNTFMPITHKDEEAMLKLINHIDEEEDFNADEIDDLPTNEYNNEIDFYVKDYKNPANMPFVPYVEGVLCKNMMGNIANSFTEVSIKAIEGRGPQYMGGQDTQLEFELITDDITIVSALNTLPTLASAMAKKYRRILPAWPIKIHSDLTRMLGVSEVLIDMMEVSTVEGFPGIYSITMRLTSVDRTQRQREALRRLDVAPQGGKVGYNYNSDLSMKNYFAVDNALAKAELYPDLDLPSISELGKLGFRFVKYSGQDRSYPDPDFYIIYNYPYTSLMIKKMIKDVISENLLNPEGDESLHSFKFKDIMGMELTGKVEAYTGISLSSEDNKQAQTYSEILKNLETNINTKLANNKSLTKQQKESIKDTLQLSAAINKLVMADVMDGWQVRPSWTAPLATKEINEAIKAMTDKAPNAFAKEIRNRRRKAIALIDSMLSKPLTNRDSDLETGTHNGSDNSQPVFDKKDMKYKIVCEKAVNDLFSKDEGLELMKLLCPGSSIEKIGTGTNNTFINSYFDKPKPLAYMIGFLFASGCALSADKEYNSKVDKKEWYPNHYITSLNSPSFDNDRSSKYYKQKLPYCITDKIEGTSRMITSIKEGIATGSTFGAWRINRYSTPDLIAEMVERESDITYTTKANDTAYNGKISPGFLDPYYNSLPISNQELFDYKESILINKQSNAEAYLRLVLLSLRKMLCDGLLISEIDILATDWDVLYNEELNLDNEHSSNRPDYARPGDVIIDNRPVEKALKELGFDTKELKEVMDSIKVSMSRSFCARLIYPFIMTATESNREIYDLFKERDYNSLNGLTSYVEYGSGVTDSKTRVIKFLAALSGINLSLSKSSRKEGHITDSQKLMNSLSKEVFIEAAEDPRSYLVHSFYDMLTNDKRGRLVRAFPTYYVVFIDEGRKIGSWKLHDNFYNMNSIANINIVKSRKIATDTCSIVMNNMFNSYTMEPDSTTTQQYTDIYGMRDVFDSIFSPKAYFDKEKRIRLRKIIPDTVVLQPGIRIHVRIGYSADGSKLPVVFNGKVAEINVEEVAQIVAQGDGHELMNPLNAFGEIEALSIDASQSDITWFKDLRGTLAKGGESPRNLLSKILVAKYGGWKKQVDKFSDGRWFNENPFGIMHFGDPKFATIFEQGEPVQNLYEVSDATLLKGINEFATEVTTKKATPTINTSIQDKTFWDLLHLAANSGENYIGAIRDFGFRSTVFLGKPNHYYAYAYELVDGKIVEKRKPFQQFHYFDSYTDIVYNSIKASEAQMKTNAVGLWQSTDMFWGRSQSTVGPIYLDMNIYPEYQKSMTVDTGLLGAGNGGIDFGLTTHFSEKWSMDVNDDKVNKALAWRVTANALKNSVKDMYQGDVCVLGDPSVKPHDRIYIHDTYEDMMGMFEVEAVIHNMSAETGFTTSIMPDVIARHGDTFEAANQSLLSGTGAMLGLGVGGLIIDKIWGSAVHGKLATVIGKADKMYSKSSKLSKVANDFYNATGMKDFLDNKPTAKALFEKMNVLPSQKAIDLEAIGDAIDYLSEVDINKLDSFEDVIKAFNKYSKLNIDTYEEALKHAFKNNKFGAANANYSLDDIDDAINQIRKAKDSLDDVFDISTFNVKEFADEILKTQFDGTELINCLDGDARKIIKSWKTGKLDDSMDAIEQIATVMREPDLLKAIDTKVLKTDTIDDFFKGFTNIFAKTNVDGKDISLFAKLSKTLKGGDLLEDLTKVFKGLLKSNWVTLLIDVAIETAVFILTKNAQEVFTRFLQSIQAVDVYPLKKNNKPLIAGMNGHKGSVQGWPVREGYDSMQGMIMQFANTIKKLDGNLPFADWLLYSFVDEGVLEKLSSEWKYDLGIDLENPDMSEEDLAQTTYGNISSMYAANNKYAYSLVTTPRINAKGLEDKSGELLKTYQILNAQPMSLSSNNKVLDLNYLLSEPSIRKAIADDRFEISHSKKPDYVINIPFESGTESVPVKIDSGVIDMPLVQDELIYVLNYLLTHESLKDYKIYFKSGTKVNDETGGWKSTGFAMILEINKSGGKVLSDVLTELNDSSNIIENSDGIFKFVRSGDKVTLIAFAPIKKTE